MARTETRQFAHGHALRAGSIGAWRQLIDEAFVPLELQPRDERSYSGTLAGRAHGPLTLSIIQADPIRVRRTPDTIDRSAAEGWVLNLQTRGRAWVSQAGRQGQLQPGDAVLFNLARPFEMEFEEPFAQLSLPVPVTALRPFARLRDGLDGVVLSGRDSFVSVSMSSLRRAARTPTSEDQVVNELLAAELHALIGTAVGLSAADPSPARAADLRRTYLRASALIDRDLASEDLAPAAIADGLRVSLRYLQLAFSAHGDAVRRQITRKRLDRCRFAIAAGRSSIADVAFTWGFRDLSTFGRAFRSAFGTTPREYRRRAR